MKWILITILIAILTIPITFAYEKIFEFDDNEHIIISTTVYNNTGKECIKCSCNLSIFNPHPNDDTINQTHWMENQNNGVYSTNLSQTGQDLSFSSELYPLTIVCNDSQGFFGGDTREGLKVSETMFDYSALIIPVIAVAFGLLWFGFKTDKNYKGMKALTIFSSMAFFFGAIALGWATMMKTPNAGDFKIVMIAIVTAFLMVLLGIMFLWYKEQIVETVTKIGQNR